MLATRDVLWSRPRSISLLVKSVRKLRPTQRRPKRPWSIFHTLYGRFFALHTYRDLCCYTGIILGHGALLRCSEFAETWNNKPVLTLGQIDLRSNEAYITIDYSKTNQFRKEECIGVPCHCTKHTGKQFGNVTITPDICPFHVLRHFIQSRNKLFGSDPAQPLLLKDNNKPLNRQNVTNWMRRVIKAINKHFDLDLNPKHYPTHSLRVGGTTDLARSGFSTHTIESQGRWLSDLWKRTYMSNDYRDIALLSGLTEIVLKEQCRYL